ncbi:hypothetical protein B0T25DRAFT_260242 [Lasiosphaeria hispida]|uniref:Chromatin structure-remodeling complex subunit rsc9 n=1 Tax=Lasiosphaeria hispida TaxID=260671 RepID=A0AAJ0HG16_9PEZI|nr:hypothetical protein B0T25DRAFT_260242 [Lasiosphaeria hispida]
MAPTPKPVAEHRIDRTPEYEKFIDDLRIFHEKRGTNFDPEPKMGTMNVDLYKLFNFIVENGGYDKVSEEKLMWRKMCEGLGLMRHNAPADAYTLKQIFYKQLAAYEIKKVHNKEPPPPEILEFTTAKGGSLLTRTLENFQAKAKAEKDESGDDGTPSRERRVDEAPNSSGRASRGLREAPAPRVIFHPDTNSTRQTRHASGPQPGGSGTPASNSPAHAPNSSQPHSNTPIPVHAPPNHHSGRGNASAMYNPPGPELSNPAVQSYQPLPPQQMPLRVVDTPTSNPNRFAKGQRPLRQPINNAAVLRSALPPGVLDGPNIYERCLFALRSGIRAEQAFGLNHLVKISFERGDKYKFSQFSGLAEGLTEFALGVGSLFYYIDWTICNDPDVDEYEVGELDGINGSSDILERIAQLKPKAVQDNFQPAEFTDHLTLITEAVLTIRNMVMLADNANYLSDYMPLKDLLCIILCLPDMDLAVELKHFALDIAEQITPYLVLGSGDPLYKTLLAQLSSTDRGTILTSLRAIGRIAMNHPTETNKLSGVPPAVLQNLMDWLLLNDDELMDACLDFLYQYTAIVANLDTLIQSTNVEHLVTQLVRLLSHGAKRGVRELVLVEASLAPEAPSEHVVPIPKDLLEHLISMEEPERCYQWLKCFFEEDPDSQITQIAIWQAYNTAFLEPLKRRNRTMINAADFIRNISTVYQTAGAQIIRDQGPMGEVQKFIIRGIRPRPFPISPEGQAYFRCQWSPTPGAPLKCGVWNLSAEKMWDHILTDHLGESPDEKGEFKNRQGTYVCSWDSCKKYSQPTNLFLVQFMMHIKTHLKTEESGYKAAANQQTGEGSSHGSKRHKMRIVRPAKTINLTYEETASVRDERNPNAIPQSAGIPLSAVLILRNIARNVGKTEAEEALLKQQALEGGSNARDESEGIEDGSVIPASGWKERLFRPVTARLWEVFTENKVLAKDLAGLFQLLGRQ